MENIKLDDQPTDVEREPDVKQATKDLALNITKETSKCTEVQDTSTYDFASLPKSMYMKAPAVSPVEEPTRSPSTVNDMLKLKLATRARLREQRLRNKRDVGRTDIFTNPEKYINPCDASVNATDGTSEEMDFLETFCAVARSKHVHVDADAAGDSRGCRLSSSRLNSCKSPPKKESIDIPPVKRLAARSTKGQHVVFESEGSEDEEVKKKKKPPKKTFIPPCFKPLPSLGASSDPLSGPPLAGPEVLFRMPAQKIPSPRMLASSPRLRAAMTFFQTEVIDEFGYSSYSDNDAEVAYSEHIKIAKQLEKDRMRQQREEAEHKNYVRLMESITTNELQAMNLLLPHKKDGADSWQKAKSAHEKLVPKETAAETLKQDALKEEWHKLEAEKPVGNIIVQRGTGKYIMEQLFGAKKKKTRRRRRVGGQLEGTSKGKEGPGWGGTEEEVESKFVSLDAFKEYKYGEKRREVGDLVEVVNLPASYEGSSPPPSPRSLHNGRKKVKQKSKKKDKRQAKRDKEKLLEDNEEYMQQRRLKREQLMLDFSKLNASLPPPRVR